MVDSAKSQIGQDYQMLCHRTCVLKEAPVGAWVEQEDLLCQIPPTWGAQPGMLAQRLLDEFLVRVDRARARRWRAAWGVRQRSLHRFRMQPPND